MQKLMPTLDRGPVPLKHIRDGNRRQLLELLDAIRGKKALILEADFASPLGLIADAVMLKEHGIEMFCVLEPQSSVIATLQERGVKHLIYLIHARIPSIHDAVTHISMCRSSNANFEYTMLTMPRRTQVAELLLDQSGLLGDVAIRGCPVDWIPLDEDLLSLEDSTAFKELTLDNNPSCLYNIALALTQMQSTLGAIPHIKGKGSWAAAVHKAMKRIRAEQGISAPAPGGEGGIDTLILIDRTVDMATPMCTQLTYEGLLDEVLGVAYGQIRSSAVEGGRKVHGLNSSDAVFVETRDKFFVGARKWLNETLKTIQQFRDSGMHSADITSLKGFVSDLKEKFSRIPLHTNLTEQLAAALQSPSFAARQQVEGGILDEVDEILAIEDLMYQGESLTTILRLLCLYCAVQGGVSKRHWDSLRRDILNTYGHQHLLTLNALSKAGLVQRREGARKSHFPVAKSAFKLLLPEGGKIDEDNPSDIHFAYAGYAPLSVRIIQQALNEGGWAGADSAMVAIPGTQFEVLQTTDEAGLPIERSERGRGLLASSNSGKKKNVLVMFIGGVTYAEISALRFLSRKGICNCNFVVGTTNAVNGKTLLQGLVPIQN